MPNMEDDQEDPQDGEMVEVDDEELPEVEDTPDGGAIVRLRDDEMDDPDEREFYTNLAATLDDNSLSKISTDLTNLVVKDKEARQKRDKQYEEGLRRTGLGDDAPGGAQFQGASKVVHPVMAEACVDFTSRTIKELFPPDGPVKIHIHGTVTKEKIDRAERKKNHMNWQLTEEMPDYRSELEQLLTQLPLGGSQYMKMYWDDRSGRPRAEFIPIDDMLLPYSATSFYTAQRQTHVQYLTEMEYENRVQSGMYMDVDAVPPSMVPDQTAAARANDKIEGRDESAFNEDGLRTIYEIYTDLDVDDEKGLKNTTCPYIVTIDKTTGNVLSIYRNWEEKDELCRRLDHIIEFTFIPWRGAYGIGLPHLIGGLSAALTGSLRALLDSAHINNSVTMLRLKGGDRGGQSLRIDPTQIAEIEGGINVDDIKKLAMPMPFNPPSPVLMTLMGFLADAAKNVIRTSLDETADSNSNAPVGTTMARIEQGLVVFSAVHARLHESQHRVLKVLSRINRMYLSEKTEYADYGELAVNRSDYEGPLDLMPVSDPNIFSEQQRFAQVQAIAARSQNNPLYNQREVEKRILSTLKIPNPDALLVKDTKPKETNAVNENVAAMMGGPVIAFPEQDHISHLQAHIAFMNNPLFGSSELAGRMFIPAMLNHIKEHLSFWYLSSMFEITSEAAEMDISELMSDKIEDSVEMDRLFATATPNVMQQAQQALGQMPQIIGQAVKRLSELAQQNQPTGLDPTTQAIMAETQRKAQSDQMRSQLESKRMEIDTQAAAQDIQLAAQKAAMDAQKIQVDQALKAQKIQLDAQGKMADLASRERINNEDNQTAKDLAALEIASGNKLAVSTGAGINPRPRAY